MRNTHFLSFFAGVIAALLGMFLYKSIYENPPPPTPSPPPMEVKIVNEPIQTAEVKKPDVVFENLAAPVFLDADKKTFETNPAGELHIEWKGVQHADRYLVKIYDLNGRIVKTWHPRHNHLFMNTIPADSALEYTPYKLTVSALNTKGKAGPESEQRDLKAKKSVIAVAPAAPVVRKNIKAPKIESITVED